MKGKKLCAFALAFSLSLSALYVLDVKEAKAGLVPFEVNDTHVQEISTNDWFITEDLLKTSKSGKISFTENSTADTRINSQYRVSNIKTGERTQCLDGAMTLKISDIAKNKRFGIVLGLTYSFEYAEAAGSTYIWFEKINTGLKLGVSVYDKTSAEDTLFDSEIAVATTNEAFSLAFSVGVNGGLDLSINEETLITAEEVMVNAKGYFGFGQTGTSVAEISDIEVYAYTNETPTNANFCERFECNEFNAIALYSRSDATNEENKGIYIENEKLAFKNVAKGHISTKRIYSNVDTSFDLQMGRTEKTDENGVMVRTVSAGFSLLFGAENYKKANGGYEIRFDHTNSDFLHSKIKTIIKIFKDGECVVEQTLGEELNIFDEKLAEDTLVNVWVSMLNGKIAVWLKFEGEVGFKKAIEYDFGTTPLGYVQLSSNGYESGAPESTLCNMTIDNLSFTNFDTDGKTEKIGFRTNIWNTDDFKYEDTWQDSDLIQ